MTVYLARHGETDWNRAGRMQGRTGTSLNARGQAQAEALGRVAQGLGIRRVIASPLARAVETGRVVASALGLELFLSEALMEVDFGACSGLTEREIEERFPGLRKEREADKWRHRWPSGESYADAVERLRGALRTGALPGPAGTLLIAHQSINRALSHLLSGETPDEILGMAQRADVLLRFETVGTLSHAVLTESGAEPVVWLPGKFEAPGKLN